MKGDAITEGTGLNIVSMRNSVARTLWEEAKPLKDDPGNLISLELPLGFSIDSNSRKNFARWNPGFDNRPETWAKISPFCRGGA